jgi:N-acetylmuramoyl-L-alanine amidase
MISNAQRSDAMVALLYHSLLGPKAISVTYLCPYPKLRSKNCYFWNECDHFPPGAFALQKYTRSYFFDFFWNWNGHMSFRLFLIRGVSFLITICFISSCNYLKNIGKLEDNASFYRKHAHNTNIKKNKISEGKNVRKSTYKEPSKNILVVIDPGHGGIDGGTSGMRGLLEKDMVLNAGKKLQNVLLKDFSIKSVLTRETDKSLSLKQRTDIANDLQASLFISLHVNSSGSGRASGFEAYYLDASGDRAAMRLAQAENMAGTESTARTKNMASGVKSSINDLQFILSDLVQNGKLHDSILLAHAIDKRVLNELHPSWLSVRSLGVKKAPFYVLMGARMPCILLEMFFADSLTDGSLLRNSRFWDDLIKSISLGINDFVEKELGHT